MATQYYNYFKGKAHRATARKAETPVISDDDEKFLNQLITSQDNAHPPVKDAQIALMDGAQNIPLPESPPELFEEPSTFPGLGEWAGTVASKKKAWTTWSWLRRDSRDATRHTATGGSDQGLKPPETEAGVEEEAPQDEEAKKEEEDMTMVLEQLNLAAVNNRVFSINDETQALLQKFNLIFKDLIHGGPTAYDDLEKLLTNGDRQLQQTFNSLPSFLQKLIEKLPESMTKGLGPEIMAAAAERAQKSGFHVENAGKAAAGASKAGLKIPGLKDLAGKPAAVTAMLRSIIRYLRARFPSFMGMNVLWSLAMFGKS